MIGLIQAKSGGHYLGFLSVLFFIYLFFLGGVDVITSSFACSLFLFIEVLLF